MLWVTISTVTCSRSAAISSSMRAVAIGSSAEVGSSNSRISGLVASARAMHSRCCWPPDNDRAELGRRSFASSHSAAPRGAFSSSSWMRICDRPQRFLNLLLDADLRSNAANAQAVGDVLEDRFRKRVGLLEHHADAHAHFDGIDIAGDQVDLLRQQHDAALVTGARRQVMHAIEAAQKRGLAAP